MDIKRIKEKVDRKSFKPKMIAYKDINDFVSTQSSLTIVNQYDDQLQELFLLRNPKYRFDKNFKTELKYFLSNFSHGKELNDSGSWFYFPWIHSLIHYLPELEHTELRTGRNKNLITIEEGKKFYNSRVGIMGMSVGSHVALTLVMNGGSKHIKLADMDIVSGSNLNRIRSGFDVIGLDKVYLVARQIYLINPYADIEIFNKGINDENIEKFIGSPRLDVLIEEMDNPYFKFRARDYCVKYRVPLVMAADNGDGAIAHVERFDIDANTPYFNGAVGNMTSKHVKKLDHREIIGVVARTVGADKAVIRMQESITEVGKTIYSWPQLGTAASMCGVVLTYLTRKLIVGDKQIYSGIFDVSLDAIFEKNYNDPVVAVQRKDKTDAFLRLLGLKNRK